MSAGPLNTYPGGWYMTTCGGGYGGSSAGPIVERLYAQPLWVPGRGATIEITKIGATVPNAQDLNDTGFVGLAIYADDNGFPGELLAGEISQVDQGGGQPYNTDHYISIDPIFISGMVWASVLGVDENINPGEASNSMLATTDGQYPQGITSGVWSAMPSGDLPDFYGINDDLHYWVNHFSAWAKDGYQDFPETFPTDALSSKRSWSIGIGAAE